MFLLPALAVGAGLAILLGGDLGRLGDVRFRLAVLVPAALAVQLVLFSPAVAWLPAQAASALHIGSYGLLVAFAVANARLRPLRITLAGLLLNAIAVAANGGRMPVDQAAAQAAGISVSPTGNVSLGAHRLAFLGDVFALPRSVPLANAFSIGDLLIGVGIVWFVVTASLDPARERALDARRLTEPLRGGGYRLLAAGRLVSHLGDWLTLTALVGWIYASTGSTGDVAVLMLARLAPPILGGGVAAVVVDRLPKGKLLAWLEAARGLVVVGALASVSAGSLPGVFAALAISGALAAVSNAAASALVPALLPERQLVAANAGLGIAKDVAMAAGAAGAGLTLSLLGISAALVVDGVTFAVAAVLFLPLPAARTFAASARTRHGLRDLLRHRRILLIIASFAAATVATGLANATLPRFLGGPHGFGNSGYSFGIAALAAGLAVGEAFVGFAQLQESAGRWIGIGLLLMATLFVLLGLGTHAPTALLFLAAIGFVDGTTDVLFTTIVQREADPSIHGAAFGFAGALMTATMMAAFTAAPLANAIASPGTVMLSASGFLIAAGAVALGAQRRGRAGGPAIVPV